MITACSQALKGYYQVVLNAFWEICVSKVHTSLLLNKEGKNTSSHLD